MWHHCLHPIVHLDPTNPLAVFHRTHENMGPCPARPCPGLRLVGEHFVVHTRLTIHANVAIPTTSSTK